MEICNMKKSEINVNEEEMMRVKAFIKAVGCGLKNSVPNILFLGGIVLNVFEFGATDIVFEKTLIVIAAVVKGAIALGIAGICVEEGQKTYRAEMAKFHKAAEKENNSGSIKNKVA